MGEIWVVVRSWMFSCWGVKGSRSNFFSSTGVAEVAVLDVADLLTAVAASGDVVVGREVLGDSVAVETVGEDLVATRSRDSTSGNFSSSR